MKFMRYSTRSKALLLALVFVITLLLGLIAHFKSQEWISGFLWVIAGATASASLTIYAIETDLARIRRTARPALRRVSVHILLLAFRLAFYVTRTHEISDQLFSAIEAFKKDGVPPQIPEKLNENLKNMELKTQPGLCSERLLPAERKAIIKAVTVFFLDDVETILKHMDRSIDLTPESETCISELMELSDQLDVQVSVLRNYFQTMKELLPKRGDDEATWSAALRNAEVINFCDMTITTMVISFQMCMKVYKIEMDQVKSLESDKPISSEQIKTLAGVNPISDFKGLIGWATGKGKGK